MAEYLYNFKNINVIIGGIRLTGFADGDDSVAIEFSSPAVNDVSGADGDAVASLIHDYRASIIIRLLQGSPSNDVLSTISAAYKVGTVVTTPFLISDAYGRSLHAAPHVYVSTRPQGSYGQNQSNREWTLRALQMVSFMGGSEPLG